MLEIQVAVVLCVFTFLCGAALAWVLQEKKHTASLRTFTASMTSKVRDRMESFELLESQVKTLLGALNQMEGAFAKQMGIQTRFMKRLTLGVNTAASSATAAGAVEDDLFVLDMDSQDTPSTQAANRNGDGASSANTGTLQEVIASWEQRCKSMQDGQFTELERLRKIIQSQAKQIQDLMPTTQSNQNTHDLDSVANSTVRNTVVVDAPNVADVATTFVPDVFATWETNDDESNDASDSQTQSAAAQLSALEPEPVTQSSNSSSSQSTSPASSMNTNQSNPQTTFQTSFDAQWVESLAQLTAQEREYAQIHERMAKASTHRELLLEALEQRVSKLNVVEAKLQRSLEDGRGLRDRCKEYEAEVASCRKEIENLVLQLAQTKDDQRKSEDQALQWQEESEAKIKHLEVELAERNETCQGLERTVEVRARELEELRGLWQGLRQQREEQDLRLADLQANLNDRGEEVQSLNSQVRNLTRDLTEAHDALGNKSSQLTSLMQNLELTQADVEQQRRAAAAKDSHLQSAASVLGRLRPLIEALEGELAVEERKK